MTGGFSLKGKRVWVNGHRGMAGSALVRRLAAEDCEILTAGRDEVDLRNQAHVAAWVADRKPQAAFIAAGTVGGIWANAIRPAEFLYDNVAIASNSIHAAWQAGVEKLIYLGSSCIYPRLAPQPMTEDMLLTGPLEPTNEWYAIAKITGIKLCQSFRRQYGCDFISAMPTNLYGPGDNYHAEHSHVVAALIRRIHHGKVASAPEVVVWGTGSPLREFLYVDDLADACVFMVKSYSGESHLNVGIGVEHSILQLAQAIARVVDYQGKLVFDTTKPDGAPRKVMDISRLADLGWRASTRLEDGLVKAYEWFLASPHARPC